MKEVFAAWPQAASPFFLILNIIVSIASRVLQSSQEKLKKHFSCSFFWEGDEVLRGGGECVLKNSMLG